VSRSRYNSPSGPVSPRAEYRSLPCSPASESARRATTELRFRHRRTGPRGECGAVDDVASLRHKRGWYYFWPFMSKDASLQAASRLCLRPRRWFSLRPRRTGANCCNGSVSGSRPPARRRRIPAARRNAGRHFGAPRPGQGAGRGARVPGRPDHRQRPGGVCGWRVFGKPGVRDRAVEQLRPCAAAASCSTPHCATQQPHRPRATGRVPIEVRFRNLSDDEIERYLDRNRR